MAVKAIGPHISDLWAQFNTEFDSKNCTLDRLTDRCKELEAQARHFESILSRSCNPIVESYMEGLISVNELVTQLQNEQARTVGV